MRTEDFSDRGYDFSLYDALYCIAERQQPKSYLEVGVSGGKSLRVVLTAGPTRPERLVLCDNWGADYGGDLYGGHTHIEALLAELGYKGEVRFLDGNSHELLKQVSVHERFDLVLVDGDHSYQGALEDLQDCWLHLRPGGLLVFDDLIHPAHSYLLAAFRQFVAESCACLVLENVSKPLGVGVLAKE